MTDKELVLLDDCLEFIEELMNHIPDYYHFNENWEYEKYRQELVERTKLLKEKQNASL